jgi:glucose/arabinose dehydrogenase
MGVVVLALRLAGLGVFRRHHPASTTLPAAFANGMFIGQHGSWNPRHGRKIRYG